MKEYERKYWENVIITKTERIAMTVAERKLKRKKTTEK
jgi:hypothetical protein